MQRIEMNTGSLQKHFSEIYRDFFAKNDLVLSWCFSMSWWPWWVWHRSDYIRIKSKVPLKCYIGIKKRKDTKINIDNVIYYDISKKKFEHYEFIKINSEKEKIILEISKFLQENSFTWWFDINFLSETTRWHSFWFAWICWSLISTWINILIWNINKNDIIENYEDFTKSKIFEKISLLAWKIDLISTYWNTAGHGTLNTLYNTKFPTYLYTEKFDSNTEINNIDDIQRHFHILSEKFKKSSITWDIMLDYLIIFSWITTETKKVEEFKKWQIKKYDSYKEFIKNDLFDEKTNIKKISFWKYIDENLIYKSLVDLISIIWIKTIYLAKKILENWYETEIAEDFIDNINQYRYAISMVEKQNKFTDDFIYFFNKNKINNEEDLWITPIYWWKLGWWYLVVIKPCISRDTIDKTIKDLKNIYPNVEIEYSSYLDWECSDWVILEQYISEWIYSKYVDKNKFVFKSNKGDNYIWDYNEILEKEKDWLLFDMINSKIYFFWEKLTSKETPSQNGTIEVITKLLENIWEEISNKDFSASSYSKNKNEMLWKIILPLIRLVEDKTKEQLPIICKWGLTNFYVKMWNVNLKIWAIKRI